MSSDFFAKKKTTADKLLFDFFPDSFNYLKVFHGKKVLEKMPSHTVVIRLLEVCPKFKYIYTVRVIEMVLIDLKVTVTKLRVNKALKSHIW